MADNHEVVGLLKTATGLIVIGCRATWDPWTVSAHLRRLAQLKHRLPQYATTPVSGAIAGMDMDHQTIGYATRKSLYIISPNDHGLAMQNPGGFRPKVW